MHILVDAWYFCSFGGRRGLFFPPPTAACFALWTTTCCCCIFRLPATSACLFTLVFYLEFAACWHVGGIQLGLDENTKHLKKISTKIRMWDFELCTVFLRIVSFSGTTTCMLWIGAFGFWSEPLLSDWMVSQIKQNVKLHPIAAAIILRSPRVWRNSSVVTSKKVTPTAKCRVW